MRPDASGRLTKESAVPSPAHSVDDALDVILQHVRVLPAEQTALPDVLGRVLAHDLTAPADLWPFPRSAMDGFALRASEVARASPDQPVTLRVTGELFAGGMATRPMVEGTAVRIATGAPVPEGADAVIPVEHAEMEGGALIVRTPVPAGRHIFPSAEDARRGEVVLTAGTTVRPGDLGLLASLGMTDLPVVRRATVAILAVGDELIDPAQSPHPGQVREGNTYALAAAVGEAGGNPVRLGIARDDVGDVVAHIRRAAPADALIVCAGISVGERDVVKQALAQAGVRLLFWRVPMKPGSPAAFGTLGSMPVFGLPGNPGAAMVAFEELVRPALRKMMGYRHLTRAVLSARLAESIQVRPGRRRYLWATASAAHGDVVVRPLRHQGTATLRSISEANALLIVEPDTQMLRVGDAVRIQLLNDLADSAHRPVPIVAVVGAKASGKTTLIEHLVPILCARGYHLAVIKHDAHGFELDHPGTDTWRAARAGAEVIAIAGPETAAMICRAREVPLPQILAMVPGVDLILLEGYSQHPVPKIEVRRDGVISDRPPPSGPILAVFRWDGHRMPPADLSMLADRIDAEVVRGRGNQV